MSVPHVAIIIVTYNGCADTVECLKSLQNLTYGNYSVVIVDQDSRDGTPDTVAESFPRVAVIRNRVNGGFAAGNNRGITFALEQGADFVFLLNNDTIVEAGILEPLVASAASDVKIAIVGPLMFYYDAPGLIWSAGGAIGRRGESVMLEQGCSTAQFVGDADESDVVDVDFVVGCGMLIRRSALEQIGLMDERFFLYYEESDLCARARAEGWRIVTARGSSLWHKVSRSTGTDSALTLYYMRRNALLYLEKNARNSFFSRAAAVADSVRLFLIWSLQGRWSRAIVLLRANVDYSLRHFGRARAGLGHN